MNHDILILIPAFNEAARIAGVVRQAAGAVPDGDILVVDDGSRDATARLAAQAGAQVVSHPFNLGYGAAVQTGYKFAVTRGYRFIVQMDGDGQHDAESVARLLAPVKAGNADFALGSRFLAGDSYVPPLTRRLGMAFFRRMVTLITGQPITDSTSGFQAFNRRVFTYFASDAFPCDYPDADVLIALHRAGFTIVEVPVRMHANTDGKSMHGGLRPLYYTFKMLLSVFVTLLRKPPAST